MRENALKEVLSCHNFQNETTLNQSIANILYP